MRWAGHVVTMKGRGEGRGGGEERMREGRGRGERAKGRESEREIEENKSSSCIATQQVTTPTTGKRGRTGSNIMDWSSHLILTRRGWIEDATLQGDDIIGTYSEGVDRGRYPSG